MKHSIQISDQQNKAELFHNLHHSGRLLILPNIWDSLGAMLLRDLGYPAIATASASVAFANGYDDGENISFDELLMLLKKIILNVDIPVTADIESGYAENEQQLKKNIQQLIEAGIAGINLEDTDKHTNSLLPIERQCEKIRLIRNVCEEMNTQLVINARTDVYIHNKDNGINNLEETIKRGIAYKAAGAGCFYPITMQNPGDITLTVKQLQMPVNILLMPGIPELADLQNMGVARVSLGPGFLKIAVQAMKNLAVKLLHHDGIDEITGNEITSAYLKDLMTKKEVDLNT
jgi:2-methylisocitrate lyase-like PEP mutase family enzyme